MKTEHLIERDKVETLRFKHYSEKEHTKPSPLKAGKNRSYTKNLSGRRSSHQITLPLEDKNGFFHGNFPVCRWPVALAVEFRVVRLVLLEHVVDGG